MRVSVRVGVRVTSRVHCGRCDEANQEKVFGQGLEGLEFRVVVQGLGSRV